MEEDRDFSTKEIQETNGLKSVDKFEELNLKPDLLKGIYGMFCS